LFFQILPFSFSLTKQDIISNKNWLNENNIAAFDDVFAHIAFKMKETVGNGSEIKKMVVTFIGTTKSESVTELILKELSLKK